LPAVVFFSGVRCDCGRDVGGVRIRHRLDDDRRATADPPTSDVDLPRARRLDVIGSVHRFSAARVMAT
jgi:hypothetical protein